MRLTLRTMLAYLDDILEPKDAEEIGKKIEQSETATNLVHRIRDVMRRLRLGAPNVSDRGAGLDPNTVAEYLDNSLPDARVPDFEKVCLESDIHLAEVASCHQVLALVLGEPAEVDPASRQQMYELPEVLASKTKPKPTPPKLPERPSTDGDHPEQIHASRTKPPVPEYLRETAKKRRLWRIVAGMAALILLILAALTATGQLEPGSRLGTLLGLGTGPASTARLPEEAMPPEPKPRVAEPNAEEKTEKPAAAAMPEPVTEPAPPPSPTVQEPKVQPPAVDAAAVVPPSGAAKTPTTTPEPEERNPLREPAAASPSKAAPAASGGMAPGGTAPPEAQSAPANRMEAEAEPKKLPADAAEPTPVPVEQVAKYISPTGLLLRYDFDAAAWQRVATNALLGSQDKLLALPAFRPVVLVAGEVRMELVDGTRVDLQPLDHQGTPAISIDFGRMILRSNGKEKSRIRISIGERQALLAFGDADSAVAIQVERLRSPGIDPEIQPLPRITELLVTTGKIHWQEGNERAPVTIAAPVRAALNDKPIEAVPVQQFPAWIDPQPVASLEQQAAATIERETQGRPIGLALRELAEHRKREVRWLAVRCLGYLGDFQPLVSALDDPDKRQDWQEYTERLREAVVRGPNTAAAIRAAMQRLHGNEGDSLYELLWKYPDDHLTPEDAAQLVRYLDHETMAFRVLAFWGNLKRITGLGLYYRPEDSAAKRQPSILKWKERMKSPPVASGGASRDKTDAAPPLPLPQ